MSYAMANAHPLAREAADRIAPRNDEDGVAQVLEQLLLELSRRDRPRTRRSAAAGCPYGQRPGRLGSRTGRWHSPGRRSS